jgi:hypothetical protein
MLAEPRRWRSEVTNFNTASRLLIYDAVVEQSHVFVLAAFRNFFFAIAVGNFSTVAHDTLPYRVHLLDSPTPCNVCVQLRKHFLYLERHRFETTRVASPHERISDKHTEFAMPMLSKMFGQIQQKGSRRFILP